MADGHKDGHKLNLPDRFNDDEAAEIDRAFWAFVVTRSGRARRVRISPDLLRGYSSRNRRDSTIVFAPKLDTESRHAVHKALDALLDGVQRARPAAFTKRPTAEMMQVWMLFQKKGRTYGAIAAQKVNGKFLVSGNTAPSRLRQAKRWVATVEDYLRKDPMLFVTNRFSVIRNLGTNTKRR